MTIVIPSQHISVNCAHDMVSICRDLQNLGITYFEHVRIYSSGHIAWLSTDDVRARSILENEISGALNFDFNKLKSHRYLFAEDVVETINDSCMRKIAVNKLIVSKDNYDIRNLFQIININGGIYEAFVFGTNEKSNILKSEYLSLLSYLEYFIFYYYEKGEKLISESEKCKIQIPDLNLGNLKDEKSNIAYPNVHKFYFDLHNRSQYLTLREFQVIRYLFNGFSRKETANVLGLKSTTIDSLISNAIERNSSFNFSHLLNKIRSSDFFHLMIIP
ncbi:TPA: LuxR C-terminal-related transcriptional regulator [Legionella feeleii]